METKVKSVILQFYRYGIPILLSISVMYQIWTQYNDTLDSFAKEIVSLSRRIAGKSSQFVLSMWVAEIILVILILIISSVVLIIANRNRILRAIISVGAILYLIFCVMDGISCPKILIVLILFYLFETALHLTIRGDAVRRDGIVFSLMPFLLLIAVLGILIPSSSKPIDWAKLFHISVNEWTYISGDSGKVVMEEYSITEAGFSGEDVLNFPSGYLGNSSYILMKLRPEGGAKGDGYFTGSIRNVYTHEGWLRDIDYPNTDLPEYKLNLYDMLYNLRNADLQYYDGTYFSRRMNVQITYDQLQTTSVFLPSYCRAIQDNNTINFYGTSDGKVLITDIRKGDTYRVYGMSINYEHPSLIAYLEGKEMSLSPERGLHETPYTECISMADNVEKLETEIEEAFVPIKDKYDGMIKNCYMALPEDMPQRIQALADELTAGLDNDYDKAVAIRDYLRTYPYNLNVEPLPEGKEFTDYFLFESKTGYCLHFATAMAVLSRCVNIPSRMVEGIYSKYAEWDNGAYLVRSKQAHAWCEVYLEGFGWYRMEATPGYTSIDKGAFIRQDESQTIILPSLEEEPEEADEQESQQEEKTKRYMPIFVAAALIILILIILATYLTIRQRKKYKVMDTEERLRTLMRQIFLILQFMHLGLEKGETLEEYAVRLTEKMPECPEDLSRCLNRYAILTYSEAEATLDDIEYFKRIKMLLCGIAGHGKYKVSFFVYKLINF